jgi:hypothetical protein
MNSINVERATSVLVEAVFFGDKEAANRYGLSVRTIDNYRKRINTDKDFAAIFYQKKQEFEKNWADEIPGAIRAGTRFLLKSFQEADYKDASVIHAVAGAMKILTEIGLAKEIIDVRLGEYNRSNGAPSHEMATLPESTS